MSKCGYFKIIKGEPRCFHPNGDKSEYGNLAKICERCKRECGGVYPSYLPHANFSGVTLEIIDKSGNILHSYINK